MLGMGWSEIFFIMIIALLAVGPTKLPEVARSLARVVRQVQRVVGEFRETIDLEEFDAQIRQSGVAHAESENNHRLTGSVGVGKKETVVATHSGTGKGVESGMSADEKMLFPPDETGGAIGKADGTGNRNPENITRT